MTFLCPGHLFTEQTDVLPQDLVKSRSREIRRYNDRIAAARVPVKS